MSAQPQSIDVETYLLVKPRWGDRRHSWELDDDGQPLLLGGRVDSATVNRPRVPRDGVAVKVTLRMPAGAFLPLQPEAVIVVGMEDLETIVVEARDPREGETDD